MDSVGKSLKKICDGLSEMQPEERKVVLDLISKPDALGLRSSTTENLTSKPFSGRYSKEFVGEKIHKSIFVKRTINDISLPQTKKSPVCPEIEYFTL